MRYAILYQFIIVKHLVISSAPLFRPTIRIANFHKTNILKNGPTQEYQPPELLQDQWPKPKTTTCSDNNRYTAAGILHNNIVCGTIGSQIADIQTDLVLRQHDVHGPVQYQFQQPFQKPYKTQFQQQNQQAFQPNQNKRPMQRPIQKSYQSSLQNPYQQPIQKPYQSPIQKPYQQLIQQSFQEPVQSSNPVQWYEPTTQQPIDMMNREPVKMSDLTNEPNTQRIVYPTRMKRIRGHLRQRKRNKPSSSTRPPYPKGIKPEDDHKDSDGEYIMCDGNAICQKHEWKVKPKARILNHRRINNIVLVKSFIH